MSSPVTPSSRVARKRARARAAIVEAAITLVRESGYEQLTIEAVAEAADVSKPSVYYYFASKEELLRELGIACAKDEAATLSRAIAALPPGASVVEALVRAFVAHHLRSMNLFRADYVMGQVIKHDPETVEDEVNPAMIALFDQVERRLVEDAGRGLLRDGVHPRRTAVTTWMAAHGVVATLSLLESSGTRFTHQTDDLVEEMCRTLTRGVYRDDGGGSSSR